MAWPAAPESLLQRRQCGTQRRLPAPVATRAWAAAAESVTRGPPAIAVPWTLAPAPTATVPANPTTPRRRGAHHPGVPGATPAATSLQQPRGLCGYRECASDAHPRGRAGEGANCRFSNTAGGRAGKRTQNLCDSTTYWKTGGIPLVINKLHC